MRLYASGQYLHINTLGVCVEILDAMVYYNDAPETCVNRVATNRNQISRKDCGRCTCLCCKTCDHDVFLT